MTIFPYKICKKKKNDVLKGQEKPFQENVNLKHRKTANENDDVSNSDPSTDEIRCQLEHCTFCDYRLCCEIVACPPEELTPCNWELKETENPAYGLSVKNWLEINHDKDGEEPTILNNLIETANSTKISRNLNEKSLESIDSTSQRNCDTNTDDMNQFNTSHSNAELNHLKSDPLKDKLDGDNQRLHDTKPSSVSWSVLKHRQAAFDATSNCDKKPSVNNSFPVGMTLDSSTCPADDQLIANGKYKWIKEKPYPLSVIKPNVKMSDKISDHSTSKADLSRQKPIDRSSKTKFHNQAIVEERSERFKKAIDPLSEISQIKTEESIQEWLARINVCGNNATGEELADKQLCGSAWDLRNDDTKEIMFKQSNYENDDTSDDNKHKSQNENEGSLNFEAFYAGLLKEDIVNDTTTLLCNASKIAPANIPMVVMQCSRLHSHIGSKKPFQQTSLPMGTLVTALYQESEWLYVQTPHGVEGFLSAANCAPIGTINEPAPMSKRPWEPCDFPIRISRHKKDEFVTQQTAYIQTKLPINGNKQSIPYISTVKIKTNFYTDRYFSNTFKSKDSIKIAKTVTDILRSSPETKISH